jgi:hypothetical protein
MGMEELVFLALFGVIIYATVWALAEICLCFDKAGVRRRDDEGEAATERVRRR